MMKHDEHHSFPYLFRLGGCLLGDPSLQEDPLSDPSPAHGAWPRLALSDTEAMQALKELKTLFSELSLPMILASWPPK